MSLAAEGLAAMLRELAREVDLTGSNDVFFRLLDSAGRQVASSELSGRRFNSSS